MSTLESHSRDALRQRYLDAWRKRSSGAILTPLEVMISDVIVVHPEYQPVLEDSDRALALDATSQSGENPFLHMGLHMAVREQIAIDRPPGVCAVHASLTARTGDSHLADHALMEALAETLWQAQRAGVAPDEKHYLELARRR